MQHKHVTWNAVALIGILVLAACGSDSSDVASLNSIEDAQPVDRAADEADTVLDNEAMMMALTECIREQGVELVDPVVDSDGNVGKPEFVEGAGYDKELIGAAWEACAEHLEGFTFEQKRFDVSEQVDQLVALANCLREKGYDVDDPTAETLDQWGEDFKMSIDWDDPDAMADYEECSGDPSKEGRGK